jgi:2-methylfumaryl-CoA isomerase
MVVGLTGKQWASLCEATQISAEMAALGARLSLDLKREGDRFRARQEIAQVLGAWIAQRRFAQVSEVFDRHGVCWSRYQSIGELVAADPECSSANPLFASVDQPGVGSVLTPGIPLDFQGSGRLPPGPAPRLGQHTEEVLAELLGIDASQFGRLHDRGVVATALNAP